MSENDEAEAIEKLRDRLKDVLESNMHEDEYMFFRFLKAQNFNVDKAEKMLRQHLEWRKNLDVNNALKWKHSKVLEKYVPYIKLGYNKEGCIVRFVSSGNIDWIGLFSSCTFEDVTKRLITYFEEDLEDLRKRSKKFGRSSGKVVCIHCLKNLSFTQVTDKKAIAFLISTIDMYLKNYPKTLKALIFINASIYSNLLYSAVKKFVPSSILKKVIFYSDESYKNDLLETIDPEVLPAFLGGTRTDPDGNPLCLTFIKRGGPVPEKYYIHEKKQSLANLPDVKKITLANASFHEEFIEVKEPDSYLEWEIEIKSRDVGFGLFHQDEEENKTEIVPVQRINTDEYAESGVYKCDNIGTYIVIFDNTYSYFRSKVIYYKIKVVTPHDEASLDKLRDN